MAAETLDRVVASVGDVAITQSDVDMEYRLESFLETGHVPSSPPDVATLNRVRDRLITQNLLAQEAAMEGADSVDASDRAGQQLGALRKKFPTDADFKHGLQALGLSEPQLLDRLVAEERTLLLIDQQLRPMASVGPTDIEAYYRNTFLPEYARKGGGSPPPLASVEAQIRELLVQKKINELLPGWIEGLKSNHRVRILDGHGE